MPGWLPKVYPILDSSFVPDLGRVAFLDRLGRSLADAGVWLMEYRNKTATDAEVLTDARVLRAALPWAALILDDRVDVALAAGFNGAHVDAGDIPPASSEGQLLAALESPADYVAFGPIFPTTTKQTSAAPIGIEGVRRFRAVAGPERVLVAAAGITLQTAPAILEAGANAVAVSAAIFRHDDPAAEFQRWMAALG
jgi:thiamine-phosphate pyrophosphorylase